MNGKLHFEMNGLFKKYNYSIDFNNKTNVLIGENGCGKSTILNIINGLAAKDFVYISNKDFDSISISMDGCSFNLKHDEVTQLEISKNPDFREMLFELELSNYDNFDKFLDDVLSIKVKDYNYQTNIYTPAKDYLNDDKYFASDEYIKFMSQYNVIYGSKLYLKCFYSFFKCENPFAALEKIVSNVQLYSFIDINETDKLQVLLSKEQQRQCSQYLDKYFINKSIVFEENRIFAKDNDTLDIIEEKQLSSGERKIIKIMELMVSVENNDFLLLDEPELSLSIYWQRYLIEDLLKHCNAKKVIIATQSPNLLNVDELDCLIPIYSDEYDYE